jgi:DNA (cytosine-5)-methyltransferase 1
MLTYGSLFAGVGGFDLGFDAAGMLCRWQCEIDRNCRKLLASRWPHAKIYEDVRTLRARVIELVDVICGGSPCTDLSVAGRRAGMAGERSGLFFEMVRICKQMRRRGGARFVVWENVDGAFSSNGGRDFAAVLRAFTGLQVEVPADGWGRAGFVKTPFPAWRWNCAWRVLDAQHFGIPQRRRRVFLVASAGTGSCAEILFEPESMSGDSPPCREEGEEIAGPIGSNSSGGRRTTDLDGNGALIPAIADCLQERNAKGPDSSTKNGHLIPVAFGYQNDGDTQMGLTGTGCPKLSASTRMAVVFDTTQITNPENRCNPQPGDPCHPLSASAHPPAITTRFGVRRLTPRECDRLMGWPEDHTASFPDTVRYRMAGNGVASPCSAWIGKRIVRCA